MKMIIVALAFVAFAAALPVSEISKPIETLRSKFDRQESGAYDLSFETENGILRSEIGELKEVLDEEKKPHVVLVVRGSYTFPGEDGKPETINYQADENGYYAEGKSVPKPVSRR